MIKLLVFDADSTLFNTSELHYKALNKALSLLDDKYSLSADNYHSLPKSSLSDCLSAISQLNGLPETMFSEVLKTRRKHLFDLLSRTPGSELIDPGTIETLSLLKKKYGIYITSNEHIDFIYMLIYMTKTRHLFDRVFTECSVRHLKPSSEMYLRCFLKAEVEPYECLAFENEKLGQGAATKAGAHFDTIKKPGHINIEEIYSKIDYASIH